MTRILLTAVLAAIGPGARASEYALVKNGKVEYVIVADAAFIASRPDAADWMLTPYNGTTGKVGAGFPVIDAAFKAPMTANLSPAKAVEVEAGGTLTLSVSVDRAGKTLEYEWRKDNVVLKDETKSSLTLAGVQKDAAGDYMCVVTSGDEQAKSNYVTVTVSGA